MHKLRDFRGWGGAQSCPSRTKDGDDEDFSTGTVAQSHAHYGVDRAGIVAAAQALSPGRRLA